MRTAKLTFVISLFACFFVVRICVGQSVQWKIFPYNDTIERSSLTFDGEGTLWAGNLIHAYSGGIATGVSRFDGATWHSFNKSDGLLYDTVNGMTRDRQGRIWTAGKLGVCYYDVETGWHALAVQDSFSAVREYLSIVCDSSGNIWTSSWSLVVHVPGNVPRYWAYSEIHRWDGHNWTTYDFTPEDVSHAGLQTWSMTVAPNGTIWGLGMQLHDSLNQFTGGLRKFDGNKWSIYTLGGKPLPKFNQSSVVECDKANNVWVGHKGWSQPGGLSEFDGVKWFNDTSSLFVFPRIRSMKFDINGRLWMGGGLDAYEVVEYNANTRSFIAGYSNTNSPLLTTHTIYSVAFDHAGNAWFSSPEGLSELKNASSVSVKEVGAETSFLNAYPNPASTTTTLDYLLPRNTKSRLAIYDVLGREVQAQTIEPTSSNTAQHLTVNTSTLPSGHYFLSLGSAGQFVTRELVIER
jgi:hypothetical protein